MSDEDIKTLSASVSVVFHCAANVRFDQALKDAVNLNTLGTNRILKLAEQMEQLKVFMHVSTAYCQCNSEVLEERAYAAPHSPMGIASMTQLLDNDILEALTPRCAIKWNFSSRLQIYERKVLRLLYFSLLKGLPNTYAYTKALTEDLVNSYSGKIPIVITRPSIGESFSLYCIKFIAIFV